LSSGHLVNSELANGGAIDDVIPRRTAW